MCHRAALVNYGISRYYVAMDRETMIRLAKRKFGDKWRGPLAEAICVSRATVGHWGTGRNKIRPSMAKLILEACK